MTKRQTLTATLAILLSVPALDLGLAQNLNHDGDQSPDLLTKPYLTPTGQVVPKPGDSQSGRQTPQERKAQRQSYHILDSICSNC
jgi:hypothetical protein